jgi:predicted Zn-dependent protease
MRRTTLVFTVAFLLAGESALPQWPGRIKSQIETIHRKYKDVEITQEEEVRLGEDVSGRIRGKYGVVQDPALHQYVGLVGTVVAAKTGKSAPPFRFIVLDTEGVNAFAAPGGFIHITRGALALMKSEAELAGVLAHEITHVTERHTIRAIQKGKIVQMAADESVSSNQQLFRRLADESYKIVLAGFGRAEELESDEKGVITSASSGYDPSGLSAFLISLKERNSGSASKQGLFASHPEMEERLEKIRSLIQNRSLSGGSTLPERYTANIKYGPSDAIKIVPVEPGSSGLAGSGGENEKKEGEKEKGKGEKRPSRFSLGKLINPTGTGEQTKQSAAVTGSGGSRGVDSELAAPGGPNPAEVIVQLTYAEIEDFKKAGNLK